MYQYTIPTAKTSNAMQMKMSVSIGKRWCPRCMDVLICDIKNQRTEDNPNGITSTFKETITCVKCMTKYNISYESTK